MSKVIKTRASKVVATTVSTPTSLEDKEYLEPKSDGFLDVSTANDELKSLLQDSGLPQELLAVLQEEYNLQLTDKDVAVGSIIKWLSAKDDLFTDVTLQKLSDRISIHDIALEIIASYISPVDIRAGRLDRKHTIPLFGEINHVKSYSNR